MSLENFMNQLMTWIETWSLRYDGGCKVILEDPAIDIALLTRAYQWTRLNKAVKKSPDGVFNGAIRQ